MTAELENLSQKSVVELADSYKEQGYQVFVKSRGADSHDFISDDEMDLIVHTEQNNVIVAIKKCIHQNDTNYFPAKEEESLPVKHPTLLDKKRRYSGYRCYAVHPRRVK